MDGYRDSMTETPQYDPQTRPNIGPGAPTEEPETPAVDPDGHPEPRPPQDPLPEGVQRENAESSLDQPSEGSE